MRNDFYVYVLLDTRRPGNFQYGRFTFDYEPFYVGKGKGRRDISHFRLGNINKDQNLKKNLKRIHKIRKILELGLPPKVVRIKTNATEQVAFKLECRAIEIIGRGSKGPLCNLTDGGEGTSGYVYTEEGRKKKRDWSLSYHAGLSVAERVERSQALSKGNTLAWSMHSQEDRKRRGFAIIDAATKRTDEEREALRIHFRNVQLNMPEEAIRRKDAKVSRGVRRYLAGRTEEDVAALRATLSKSQLKYWSNLTDEERESRSSAISKGYANKPQKELEEKNAKISETIARQHAEQSLYSKRVRAYNVMCGVMLRNAGLQDDLSVKSELRRRGERFYSRERNLDHKPAVLREKVRNLIRNAKV